MRRILSVGFLVLISMAWPTSSAQVDDVTAVVQSQEAYIENQTGNTRASLLAALQTYNGAVTVETVQAYMLLVANDATEGDASKMRESAAAAAAHLEPVADILPKQYVETKFVAAIGYFNDELAQGAMLEMAHVEGLARQIRNDVDEQPEWAWNLMWRADAWGMTMQAYFESAREPHPSDSEINEILDLYGADPDKMNAAVMADIGEEGLPPCPGRMIQRPRMRYPSGRVRRGMFGAVILGLEFDAAGNVINPRVLASVPIEEFDEKSLRVVGKWRFKPDDESQVGVSCRIQRTNVVQPLIFSLG